MTAERCFAVAKAVRTMVAILAFMPGAEWQRRDDMNHVLRPFAEEM
jgi:hypothetical protein